MEIKEYRQQWERLSKMDATLKVNRELGRFWALWQAIKKEPWTAEVEDAFATVAYHFFAEDKNYRRTIVNAAEYKHILGDITKIGNDPYSEQIILSAVNGLMIYAEGNDIRQIQYPDQFNDAPHAYWPTLAEQTRNLPAKIKEWDFMCPNREVLRSLQKTA